MMRRRLYSRVIWKVIDSLFTERDVLFVYSGPPDVTKQGMQLFVDRLVYDLERKWK